MTMNPWEEMTSSKVPHSHPVRGLEMQIASTTDKGEQTPGQVDGLPCGAAAAFAVYEQLASTVTERLNQRTFDFASDIAPHVDEHFIEVVDGRPLDLEHVEETFSPIVKAIAVGASFSWSVRLEQGRDLASDITLLITVAQVSVTPAGESPDLKRYRITNLLSRNSAGKWVFLHQHRTEIPEV
ncbi:hypothetical protein ACF064_32830 [Streptomyces sp. NPDC015492]|uniref:hypothetical protein n=1 Tax=Streptomyces sp. NPDC015492 TaxID=3364958 RepID=UPI0036FA4DCF